MAENHLAAAYQYCQKMADCHYENFPVASRLLPSRLRAPVSAIYAFARTADDYADEGDLDTVTRLAKLDDCDDQIKSIFAGKQIKDPIYIALSDSIQRYSLPASLFHDLISAFRQDVTITRYETFNDVLDYCRRSANPVGRLLLHLLDKADNENCHYSDNICSALQLINFYQDIHQDYTENNRIYLALDEMRKAGVTEGDIASQSSNHQMQTLMLKQHQRAGAMLCAGLPLSHRLGLRMNLEISATINGGLRVLTKLKTSNNVFSRPRLNRFDIIGILIRALFGLNTCRHFQS
jgi:squalene synthase HpnC